MQNGYRLKSPQRSRFISAPGLRNANKTINLPELDGCGGIQDPRVQEWAEGECGVAIDDDIPRRGDPQEKGFRR